METILVNNEDETKIFAYKCAANLKQGDIIALSGELGAGKSSICRYIVQYLCGIDVNVVSPTFNLLQTYQAPKCLIYHYDLYRLTHMSEIYELGIEEAFHNKNICLIEWPQIIYSMLPDNLIAIDIKIINEEKREIYIKNMSLFN